MLIYVFAEQDVYLNYHQLLLRFSEGLKIYASIKRATRKLMGRRDGQVPKVKGHKRGNTCEGEMGTSRRIVELER
jgi:hypothetical protein